MSRSSIDSGSTSPWYGDLLKAIKSGDESRVKVLVLVDDAEKARTSYRTTLRRALQTAAALGKTPVVQLLLDHGAEVEAAENEVSALFRAVEWGHCSVVKTLIGKVNLEVKDKCQRTVLFHAVSKAQLEIVEELVWAGADLSVRDADTRTVLLHVAAQKQDSKIERQYGPFPRDPQEPNHLEGQEIVKFLVERNIDLEVKDKLDRTVLHWAAATGKEKLLRSLIWGPESKRAKIDAANRRSKTALHLAAENNYPEIARILLDQGADFNATSDGAWTPLHIAASGGHLDIVILLSHHGANLNAATTNGMTPLHWAATNGHVEIVRELLNQPKIKRHPKDSLGYTPLMRAAQHKHTVIAHLLSSSYDGKDLSDIARQACTEFKATITDFFPQKQERRKFAVFNKPTVFDLLYGITKPKGEKPKGDNQGPGERKPLWTTVLESTNAKPAFRWIHLPANNMAWAEALITKYFTERGLVDVDGFKALAKSMSDQHRGKTDHSQFMRPSCQRLPSSPRIPQIKEKRVLNGAPEKRDRNDDSPTKAPDKDNKRRPNEMQRIRSGGKETLKNHIPETPSHSTGETKKTEERTAVPAIPPSPTRRRPSNTYFSDIALARESFQRPAPLSNDSTLVGPDSGIMRSATDKSSKSNPDKAHRTSINPANFALFIPYLHYETDMSRRQMRETINKAFARRRARKESQAAATVDLTKAQMLDKKILLNDASLPPRRTLDHFYYPALNSDTSSQTDPSRSETDLLKDPDLFDCQNVSKVDGPKRKNTPKTDGEPKQTQHSNTAAQSPLSKDQKLIHAYLLNAPPLHPRRTLDQFYYSAFDTEARDQDQVVYRYCDKHKMELRIFMVDQLWLWILGDDLIITSFPQRWDQPQNDPFDILHGIIEDMFQPRVASVYDLASRITGRCSGMFYQDWHDDDYHFLEMFEHSIGDLESKEPKLVSDFDKYAKQAKDWFDNRNRTEKYPKFDHYFMNIGEEMALLAEIKDIRNELSMISTVLTHQASCLADLNKAIQGQIASGGKKEELEIAFDEQGKIIKGYVENISRMDNEASDLYNSVNPLLDLKQKYAGVFEARYARIQATSAVRQGHTIMVFTIVTIVFLPMSFIAAFFAVNVHEFPTPLHLSYVSKYTFGIGLAISLPLIIGALTIDNVVRHFNRMIAPVTAIASSSSETDPLTSATAQILNARKWKPPWLWHPRILGKEAPAVADSASEFSYKLPGRTPTVLSNTGNPNKTRNKMGAKDTTTSFATVPVSPTTATAVTTAKGTPESRESPFFEQGIFSGRRRFSLVPRGKARASIGPGAGTAAAGGGGGGADGDLERGGS